MIPYEQCTYFTNLYETVSNCFGGLTQQQTREIIRNLVFAPDSDKIEINKINYSKADVMNLLRQEINAENNPLPFETRYTQILESVLKIIKHMNDGYISAEDHEERNGFLKQINAKEFQLFFLLAMIKCHPETQNDDIEKLLSYKIARLRELNDLILNYTRNEVDIKTDRTDYEKAKVIYKMLKSLQNLGYGYSISKREKQNLGIDHEDDEDLSENFAFQDWIKRLMLLQLRREERLAGLYETNSMDDICQTDEKLGYTTTFFDDINGRISELRGALKKRKFDTSRYNMLEETIASDLDAHEL